MYRQNGLFLELLNDIEMRFRQMVREEVERAMSPSFDPEPKEYSPVIANHPSENRPQVTPSLLNAKEVAVLLGVDVQRVYELARTRKKSGFPVIRLGERSYRFSKESLIKWLENQSSLDR